MYEVTKVGEGLWRAGPGFVPARGLRVVPGSWARERLLRERLAEDDGAGLPDDSALHPSLQVASEGFAVDRSSDAVLTFAQWVQPRKRQPPLARLNPSVSRNRHPRHPKTAGPRENPTTEPTRGRVQKNARAAADVDYPAYGVTGPNKEGASPTADRKLAQSAQMYHFQHQKQQMIAVEKNQANRHTSASDVDTEEEENEEGDYTVYECPGMASGGELEVKNPLFQDDRPVLPVPAEEEEEKRKRSPP
ncbi:conserved hypothetical protein [Ixodes scapularis]|uniref:Neural proliferation differentiation and control protein 1 n=1 Tax=Ixodes scapularis TaxID=6945 RepID=B7Q943_IXOSC|nr:conserved hypothetical protein [Ixodes scapularis]|eukprot:XP_002405588.1 conserved hypothetical protein [Ixodes scapularis]